MQRHVSSSRAVMKELVDNVVVKCIFLLAQAFVNVLMSCPEITLKRENHVQVRIV